MNNAAFWVIFWVLYSIATPLVLKLYLSKSKELPVILKVVLLLSQVAVLALVFMPWTTLNGQLYSGYQLAVQFSYSIIYVFIGLTILTAVLLIIGKPPAVWLASILNVVNSIFLFYMMIKLSGATNTNVSQPAAIIEAFILMIANVVAILLAGSTKLSSDSILGKLLNSIAGQGNYIDTLKETAIAIGSQYVEPESAKESKVIQGTINGYQCKIYDFPKTVGNISMIGVFRVEIEINKSNLEFIIAFPKASAKYYAYLNNVIQGDTTDPLNFFKSLPDSTLNFDTATKDWLVKLKDSNDSAITQVIEIINSNFQNIRNGWVVSVPGKMYYETTFMNRPKYSKDQLLSILNMLTGIANLTKATTSPNVQRSTIPSV